MTILLLNSLSQYCAKIKLTEESIVTSFEITVWNIQFILLLFGWRGSSWVFICYILGNLPHILRALTLSHFSENIWINSDVMCTLILMLYCRMWNMATLKQIHQMKLSNPLLIWMIQRTYQVQIYWLQNMTIQTYMSYLCKFSCYFKF